MIQKDIQRCVSVACGGVVGATVLIRLVRVGCYCKWDSPKTNCKCKGRRRSCLSHFKSNTSWTPEFHHNPKLRGSLSHQETCRWVLAQVHITWPRGPRPQDLLGLRPYWTYWSVSTRSFICRHSQGRSTSLVFCNGVSVFLYSVGVCFNNNISMNTVY